MKTILGKAKTTKEVKKILFNNKILIDGKRVTQTKYLVGLMDTISLVEAKEQFRILLNEKGQLTAIPIPSSEASIKPCMIVGKQILKKGKMQLNLSDGRNQIIDKDPYKVGDTIILSLPKQQIKTHLAFEKGAYAFLTGGKFSGKHGVVEDIKEGKIICKIDGEVLETQKRFAFIIGKGKSTITLKENESDAKHKD
jgi:small subunit ribosomal protein S4e